MPVLEPSSCFSTLHCCWYVWKHLETSPAWRREFANHPHPSHQSHWLHVQKCLWGKDHPCDLCWVDLLKPRLKGLAGYKCSKHFKTLVGCTNSLLDRCFKILSQENFIKSLKVSSSRWSSNSISSGEGSPWSDMSAFSTRPKPRSKVSEDRVWLKKLIGYTVTPSIARLLWEGKRPIFHKDSTHVRSLQISWWGN